jgi:hypothetical protein
MVPRVADGLFVRRRGQPDYDEIRPAFAAVIRRQLPDLQKALARLGPLESATFKATGRAGDDTYVVKFERGEREFHIMLEPDGRVRAIQFDP